MCKKKMWNYCGDSYEKLKYCDNKKCHVVLGDQVTITIKVVTYPHQAHSSPSTHSRPANIILEFYPPSEHSTDSTQQYLT